MDIYSKYKSKLGYELGNNGIDSYGVNHQGFSIQDELAYQFAREQRELDLLQQYNKQGINFNYPQYTTNFWGSNPDNNYGFGNSNISTNVDLLNKTYNFDDIYYSKYDEKGNIIYKGISDEEGGYSNRAVDTPTNYGITQSSLDEYNSWNSHF